jgi:hypothetical protein
MAVWVSNAELFPNLSYYLNVKSQSKLQSYMNHLVYQLKFTLGYIMFGSVSIVSSILKSSHMADLISCIL